MITSGRIVHGQNEVLTGHEQVDDSIFELARSNQIAVDRIQKQMRFVFFRLNQNVSFVGEFQISNRIVQLTRRSERAKERSVLDRVQIARPVGRTRNDQIQFGRNGDARHFVGVTGNRSLSGENAVRIGVERGDRPDDARSITRTGDEEKTGRIQRQTRHDVGVKNRRLNDFRFGQRINLEGPVPMAAAEEKFCVVRNGEETRADRDRGRKWNGRGQTISKPTNFSQRKTNFRFYFSKRSDGSRSKVKRFFAERSNGNQPEVENEMFSSERFVFLPLFPTTPRVFTVINVSEVF